MMVAALMLPDTTAGMMPRACPAITAPGGSVTIASIPAGLAQTEAMQRQRSLRLRLRY